MTSGVIYIIPQEITHRGTPQQGIQMITPDQVPTVLMVVWGMIDEADVTREVFKKLQEEVNRTGYLLRHTNKQDVRHWALSAWRLTGRFALLGPEKKAETGKILNHTKRKQAVLHREPINAGTLKAVLETFVEKAPVVTCQGNYIAPQDHKTLDPPK